MFRVCKVSLDLAGDGLLQFFGGGNYTGFLGHGAVRLALAIQKSFGLSGVTAIVTESAFWSYGTLYSKYQGGYVTSGWYYNKPSITEILISTKSSTSRKLPQKTYSVGLDDREASNLKRVHN